MGGGVVQQKMRKKRTYRGEEKKEGEVDVPTGNTARGTVYRRREHRHKDCGLRRRSKAIITLFGSEGNKAALLCGVSEYEKKDTPRPAPASPGCMCRIRHG